MQDGVLRTEDGTVYRLWISINLDYYCKMCWDSCKCSQRTQLSRWSNSGPLVQNPPDLTSERRKSLPKKFFKKKKKKRDILLMSRSAFHCRPSLIYWSSNKCWVVHCLKTIIEALCSDRGLYYVSLAPLFYATWRDSCRSCSRSNLRAWLGPCFY